MARPCRGHAVAPCCSVVRVVRARRPHGADAFARSLPCHRIVVLGVPSHREFRSEYDVAKTAAVLLRNTIGTCKSMRTVGEALDNIRRMGKMLIAAQPLGEFLRRGRPLQERAR